MVKVAGRSFTDEEAMALSSFPSEWVWCEAAGFYFASRPDGRFPATDYKALGPFLSVAEMCAAVRNETLRVEG